MKFDNGIGFLDYARNYTFSVISGVGSVPLFVYGIAKDKPSFIVGGIGALTMASLRALNGCINLRKMKELYEENQALKKRLEFRVSD